VTLKVTRGHNKDHRPDLKQFVFDLTVTSDGAVPIHYKGYDGNRTDDTTHVEIWDTLRKQKGSPDFIYVAGSKLCVSETMRYIEGEDGFFITVMPRTRSEDKWFREHIINNKCHGMKFIEFNIQERRMTHLKHGEWWNHLYRQKRDSGLHGSGVL